MIYTTAKQTKLPFGAQLPDISVLRFQRQGHLPFVFYRSRQDREMRDTCLPVCRTFTLNALWFVVVVACLQNLALKVMVSPKPLTIYVIASHRGLSAAVLSSLSSQSSSI